MEDKIDFVITWVNGNDPNWINKKEQYVKSDNKKIDGSEKRYRDYNTLKFLLRSIEKYASWVNKIYLVTDSQVPVWMKKSEKLTIVDHKTIIPHNYLPVFNSNAIEWYLDNIPNLNDKFVYFNDDMIINNKVKKEDFFDNNLPKDFRIYTDIVPLQEFNYIQLTNDILMNKYITSWPKIKKGLFSKYYGKKNIRNILFELQARKTGIPGYLEEHGPLSYLKKSFKIAKKIWKKEILETTSHKFRSRNDISIWLIRHLQLELGMFEPKKYGNNIYCSVEDIDKIQKVLFHGSQKTLCINDDVDINDKNAQNRILNLLSTKFPKKSSFEK